MKELFLQDLAGCSQEDVQWHMSEVFRIDIDEIKQYTILIGYESVGNWGCDSNSFFLMEKNGTLYENHGSHCSCYGFEGQFSPEITSVQYLKEKFNLQVGGYDRNSTENKRLVKEFIDKEF